MSDNIPFEIQAEIIKSLPVKSLIRFRSVSKAWKSLIESSDFIARYSGRQQHLLVSYKDSIERKYVSVVDDDTFPHHKVSVTVPESVKMLTQTVGSSHGLLCLYRDYVPISRWGRAVIWNPLIRKAVAVVVPNVGDGIYETILGFGVCPETTDPKIVKITYIDDWSDTESISCIPYQVEVFTLSTWDWRDPYSNPPRKSIRFGWVQVVVDGFLYWLAIDRMTMDEELNIVISFDLTSEEFTEVNLPHSLAHQFDFNLSMSKLRESLVILEDARDASNPFFIIWMMEDGVSKSFTKLFSFIDNAPTGSVKGLRKSGEVIIEMCEDGCGQLVIYEPSSKHIDKLGIDGRWFSFFVYPYTESLLLLDQSNITSYNEMDTLNFF